jgi:transposase
MITNVNTFPLLTALLLKNYALPRLGRLGCHDAREIKLADLHLGLCPNNSISGGKVLHRATRKVYNRTADTLRLCAQSLTHSKSALGAKYRRLKARLGAPNAIVAMAHHFARLVYRMLRYGQNYVEQGIHQYELKFQLQRIKWLKKEARSLNLQLVPA